jgi:TonB family protein
VKLRGERGASVSGENVLQGCLVESDPATIARARQAKRRALMVAILLQVLLVGLLVLAPLLGAVEKLPMSRLTWTPYLPYKGGPRTKETTAVKQQGPRKPRVTNPQSGIMAPQQIPPKVAIVNDPPELIEQWQESNRKGWNRGEREGIGMDLFESNERRTAMPKAPEPPAVKPKKPVHVSEPVQLARLVHRVEPVYPRMLIAARLEARVVLRAVIGKDGTIQSLEVLSGNPLFIAAARDAIARWRYQPTLLNGEPVEVETVITVVFTLRR